MQKLQLFAWQAADRGNDVHLNANPTQGELLHQEFKQRKEKLRDTSKVSILAKYGGAEYLEKAPKELLEGQTEEYVEYSRSGQVVKGRERAKTRSKYPEDGTQFNTDIIIIRCPNMNYSPRQQPHRCLGFLVRSQIVAMGLYLLSLHHPYILLLRRGWYRSCQCVIRTKPPRNAAAATTKWFSCG